MAELIFILGHSCSGKTTLAREIISKKQSKKECWAMLDKDTVGDKFSRQMLRMLGLPELDRDSPEYKKHIRDLEYLACLDVIREQLKNNISVVTPGPWTKEINNGFIFDKVAMNIPKNTKISYVFLDIPEDILKIRMINRQHPRDKWKLDNWNIFRQTLKCPDVLEEMGVIRITNENLEEILNKILPII